MIPTSARFSKNKTSFFRDSLAVCLAVITATNDYANQTSRKWVVILQIQEANWQIIPASVEYARSKVTSYFVETLCRVSRVPK